MSTDKEPIPEEFLRWAKSDAESKLQLPEGHSYGETSMYAQFVDDFVYGATTAYRHLSSQPSPGLRWVKQWYKKQFSNPVLADDCERPKDKHCVLVMVEGNAVPYVAWCKTWSDGAFWIIPGGTPESHNGKPFIVTRWCDCLPEIPFKVEETPDPTCSYPDCYPEGGGEGEEKAQEEDIWVCPKCGYGINYHESCEGCPPYPAPEAQPIADNPDVSDINVGDMSQASVNELADGKEVPEEIAQWIKAESAAFTYSDRPSIQVGMELMYHKMQEEMVQVIENAYAFNRLSVQQANDLLAARNKNNDDAIEIARLQAELKGCQENLTAMIEVDLQKSEQLDDARGYFEKIKHGRSTFDMAGNAKTYLAKYPSPTQNPDK